MFISIVLTTGDEFAAEKIAKAIHRTLREQVGATPWELRVDREDPAGDMIRMRACRPRTFVMSATNRKAGQ